MRRRGLHVLVPTPFFLLLLPVLLGAAISSDSPLMLVWPLSCSWKTQTYDAAKPHIMGIWYTSVAVLPVSKSCKLFMSFFYSIYLPYCWKLDLCFCTVSSVLLLVHLFQSRLFLDALPELQHVTMARNNSLLTGRNLEQHYCHAGQEGCGREILQGTDRREEQTHESCK